MKIIILIFASLLILSANLFGQSANSFDKYFVIKAGKGFSYGGYGLNIEYRRKHFAYTFSTGYIPIFQSETYSIPSSYNLALASKYYFLNNMSSLKPFVGIHIGWLNNYYHDKIGNMPYDPIVYGSAMTYGIEVSEEMVHFSFSFGIDPGFAIFDRFNHPYYNSQVYISTNIGIGVNLYNLPKISLKRRIKEDINIDKDLNNSEIKNLPVNKNECFNQPYENNNQIIKGHCKDLIIYQQINTSQFIYIVIKNNISTYNNYISVYQIDSLNNKDVSVYIIEESNFSKISCENYSTLIKSRNNVYLAFDGTTSIKVNEDESDNYSYNISIQLKNMKFAKKTSTSKEQIYYDEILICNLKI